jgi:hypothetical protein
VDPRFPAWYIAAALEPKDEFLRKRWQAVTEVSNSISLAGAFELVRIFYRMPPSDSAFLGNFEAAIQKHDAAFSAGSRPEELSVLAAAIITELHQSPSEIADLTSLAVTAYNCGGLGSPGAVPSVVDLHRDYLIHRSQDQRSSSDDDFETISTDLEAVFKKAENADEPLAAVEHVTEGTRQMLAALINRLSEMKRRQQLFREESDVLWWVAGGYSRDFNKPFGDFKSSSACIVVGKELADLVAEVSGPFAASAFINRILKTADDKLLAMTTLTTAVNGVDLAWVKHLIAGGVNLGAEAFCPVTLALIEHGRSGGKSWSGAYKVVSPVSPAAKMLGNDLSSQMYRECLLLKRMRKSSGDA